MKTLVIEAQTGSAKEVELNVEANTVYSFFNSILIDELSTLQEHQIHTDANALSNGKNAYFVGEQLLVGDALIIGKDTLSDKDVTISLKELQEIMTTELPIFYKKSLELLARTEINLYRTFRVEKATETMSLNVEWVLYAFNMADDKTKDYFLEHLEKTLNESKSVEEYLQKMAGLAFNVS